MLIHIIPMLCSPIHAFHLTALDLVWKLACQKYDVLENTRGKKGMVDMSWVNK